MDREKVQYPTVDNDLDHVAGYPKTIVPRKSNGAANKLEESDRPIHDWYRFVLSYPPHLVRDYMARFDLKPGQTVMDPFCGTGTTVVEAKRLGLRGVGIEANPVAYLAGKVKTNWNSSPKKLRAKADACAVDARATISRARKLRTLPEEEMNLLLTDSICPVPLHKALVLRESIDQHFAPAEREFAQVALAKTLVFSSSNLHFGPEVGVRGRKEDSNVVGDWLANIEAMADDLESVHKVKHADSRLFLADSRDMANLVEPGSIDAVFTSPPYPNEKDYTRTTRLESVILGLITSKMGLRGFKKGLLRSNTRGVYKDDTDDKWVQGLSSVQSIAEEIERRRIAMNKTSGFEKLYARVTKLYFGGMARHFAEMRYLLKPGAMLGYVVGDQASYLQVMIRTSAILAEIAESLGYEVVRTDLFRTRIATATKAQMREEVLVLRWPG